MHVISRIIAALVVSVVCVVGEAAQAAERIVIFPFDLLLQKKEEDFFYGASKPSPDEQRRLAASLEQLRGLIAAEGRYEIVDIAPFAKEIEEAAPLYDCNGCELDLAKKIGSDVAVVSVVDKASDTLLNMQINIVNVATGATLKRGSVVIQGNTDEAWARAVKWIHKNKLAAGAEAQPKVQP
jgi:hypothetical protein